jgi:predicted RNA methylase
MEYVKDGGIMGSSGATAERLRDAGWTPGIRDLPGLLDLVAGEDEDAAHAAERAVLRIEARQHERVARETVERARAATRPARGRLTRLAGRFASESVAHAWLLEAIADADPKTRRNAARAIGKARSGDRDASERALLAAWDRAESDDDKRALAEALAKIGSRAAKERIGAAASLGRRATRASVVLDRSIARETPGAIDPSRELDAPCVVRLHCRAGLEEILAGELGEEWRPRVAGPGVVEGRLVGPLSRALAIRTATHVGFPLDPVQIEGDAAETIVRALVSPAAMRVFSTFTRRTDDAPIRFRLSWLRGGHHRPSSGGSAPRHPRDETPYAPRSALRVRRSLAWRCAELVRAQTNELVNDPTATTWEITVDDSHGAIALELSPRAEDARFVYRVRTVPASSHPTIAAALARVAYVGDDDVVWDPFCGAGAELVERAKLGRYARLVGTDVERTAIDAARANLSNVPDAVLEIADATEFSPEGVDVIVTNPPMGRRMQRGSHAELLERFVDHAANVLAPGGILVWTVPEPRRIHARAERAGLVLERAWTVDMGGFPAALSLHRKLGRDAT